MRHVIQVIGDTGDDVKKPRKVVIIKQKVYEDVETHTYKYTEAAQLQSRKAENAISADTTETLDGASIARFVQFREAQLRRDFQKYMPEGNTFETDDMLDLDNCYVFWFMLPTEFKDSLLRSLTEYVHRFLVFGALYDWYRQLGMLQQAAAYKQDLDDLEADIKAMLMVPSRAKKPLQPFGPAYRMKKGW
jgi:hypothetical protein